jgi:uncharacterized protein YcbK (DUF882 family)
MGDLSPHFSRSEFRSRDGGALVGPSPALVHVLEHIRALRPGPLRIVSGYRTPAHNAAVGGAKHSRHMYGDAADIPAGRATLSEAWSAGAVGVGTSGQWATHVDTRPGPRRHWRY